MNTKASKKAVFQYRLFHYSSSILGICALTLLREPLNMEIITYILLACAYIFLAIPKINTYFYKKYISVQLEWKLDPGLYLQSLDRMRVVAYHPQRLLGNYYAGNYREAAQVSADLLTQKAFRRYWHFFHAIRLRIFLETDDKERLAEEYDAYTACIQQIKNIQRREKLLEGTRWYRYWLDGDTQRCLQELKDANDPPTPLNQVTRDYLLAILYHRSGNNEQAQPLFTQIINRAPNLYYAQVAKDCLQAMEQNEKHCLQPVQTQPNPSVAAVYKRSYTLRRIPGTIVLVAAVLLVLMSLYSYFRPVPVSEYISLLVAEEFGSDATYQYVTIVNDNGTESAFCVISAKEELYAIWFYPEGDAYFWMEAYDAPIQVGETYHLTDPWEYSCIDLLICDDQEAVPKETLQVKAMEDNGKTLYICILSQSVYIHENLMCRLF